ncbi:MULTISPECIES: hypothetical protein [Pseudomonas]|uniref:hypothetical protein n=1 Tax=Pseudomonas TaxID=286 RepID=UPI0001E97552|nr:hypothetical protein [Pseudomonas sp. FP597]EFQ61666.1 hypothetical protein PFWH6_4621 [Pseudomonas fluorescens WH6]WLI05451.1 hypothetical protein PSH66_23065 [Pseudomonas sp. FP597]
MIAAGAATAGIAALAPIVLPLAAQVAGMAADTAKQVLDRAVNFADSNMSQQKQIRF